MNFNGFLILGQGLAGTALAWRFREANIPFRIIDDGHRSSSSIIAAGIWNPLVFRRITHSWLAPELIPALEGFYQGMNKDLVGDFYRPRPFHRVHSSATEVDSWSEKLSNPAFAEFLGNQVGPTEGRTLMDEKFGASQVHRAGYVKLDKLLQLSRERFRSEGSLVEMQISDHANVDEILAKYASDEMDRWAIIDCRGYKSAFSPWWQYLPFGLTKGELLTIHCPRLDTDAIWNAGFFIFRQDGDQYCLGATFSWAEVNQSSTAEAREELLEKLRKHIQLPFTVIEHKAGVRPTVQDRRPLIGKHPKHENLYLFNGLGTKGVMLAPYFSTQLIAHLQLGAELMPEVNINRFESLLGSTNTRINHPVK